MKILLLASGNGGTMKFLYQAFNVLGFDARIVACISDRECGAVEFARNTQIESKIFAPWHSMMPEIINTIRHYVPDIVITNIHRILPREILECCEATFINLHYSLLPAFGGLVGFQTLKQAKLCNAGIIGATCHIVTEELDGGRIISQAAIPVDWGKEDIDDIGDRVFRIACLTILNALCLISGREKNIYPMNKNVLFSPCLKFDPSKFDESFWSKIRQM